MSIFYHNGFRAAALSMTSSLSVNVGTTFQKLIHNENNDLPEDEKICYLMRWEWWISFSFIFCGGWLDFAATAFGNAAIVTAFGGVASLLCSLCVALWYFHENVGKLEVLGVFFMVVGSIVFCTDEYKDVSLGSWADLMNNFSQIEFQVYSSFTILYALFALFHIYYNHTKIWVQEFLNEQSTGPIISETLTAAIQEHHWYDTYLFSSIAGIFGSYSILFASCVSKSILLRMNGETAPLWGLGFAFLTFGTIIIQTHLMNKSFQCGDLTVAVPSFQCCFATFGVMSGNVFFEQKFVRLFPLSLMIIGFIILMNHTPTKFIKNAKVDSDIEILSENIELIKVHTNIETAKHINTIVQMG